MKRPLDEKLRAWWSHRQGLDGRLVGARPAEVLEQTGWARSVGGVGPYLTLFARGGALMGQSFDAGSLRLKGEPFPVAEPIRTQPNGGADFSTSEDGTLVYAAGGKILISSGE